MYDDNVGYEIDEEDIYTDDDCYIEEVDNTIWITELIRDIDLD